jgi:hypothetical protein
LPDGFANPWGMPGTAIYGTPNGQDNGIPTLTTGAAVAKPSIATPAGSAQQKAK